jgi:hypothetical protein
VWLVRNYRAMRSLQWHAARSVVLSPRSAYCGGEWLQQSLIRLQPRLRRPVRRHEKSSKRPSELTQQVCQVFDLATRPEVTRPPMTWRMTLDFQRNSAVQHEDLAHRSMNPDAELRMRDCLTCAGLRLPAARVQPSALSRAH